MHTIRTGGDMDLVIIIITSGREISGAPETTDFPAAIVHGITCPTGGAERPGLIPKFFLFQTSGLVPASPS